MLSHELNNRYKQDVLRNPQGHLQSYREVFEKVQKSPAKYKGKPVEFLYQPMFFSMEDVERIESLTSTLWGIMKKVINEYLKNRDFRKAFGFSPFLEELILTDPGYSNPVPMARYDVFYHGDGSFQFCELNADGSSGMVESRELEEIIYHSLAMEKYKKEYEFQRFELFQSWTKALLENYYEFSGNRSTKPQVAIVDWIDGNPPSEFVEFKKEFENAGIETVIADPRELTFDGENLYYKDFRIDCIYRRVVTWELEERKEEIQDFLDAYRKGKICMVGPIRSQIIHNKVVFSILHDEELTPFLTKKERNFVADHIPFTATLDLKNPNLLEMAQRDKDQYVLKPLDKYACLGVSVGKDYLADQWRELVDEKLESDYLIQEYCDVPSMDMAIYSLDRNSISFTACNYITGLFMYNGKFQGIYHRAGRENVIGSVVESFTLPNYLVKGEKEWQVNLETP